MNFNDWDYIILISKYGIWLNLDYVKKNWGVICFFTNFQWRIKDTSNLVLKVLISKKEFFFSETFQTTKLFTNNPLGWNYICYFADNLVEQQPPRKEFTGQP